MSDAPSSIAPFILAFRDGLRARADLQALGIKVLTVYPGQDIDLDDTICVVAGRIPLGQDYVNNLRGRDEPVVIPGILQASDAARDTDAAFVNALGRAQAMLDAIVLELRDNTPQVARAGTMPARISSADVEPAENPDGGWTVRIAFATTYRARVK